jgi:hypothetical protein
VSDGPEFIRVDATAEELERWQAAADRVGLSLETWVRRMVRRRIRREQIAERCGFRLG